MKRVKILCLIIICFNVLLSSVSSQSLEKIKAVSVFRDYIVLTVPILDGTVSAQINVWQKNLEQQDVYEIELNARIDGEVEYELIGLMPSTAYEVFVRYELMDGSMRSTMPQTFITASSSSGEMRFYFLNGVDESVSSGTIPEATDYESLLNDMYDLIDNAKSTIDVAVYNTSWTGLVTALNDAVERGVRVRYIHDDETNNTALQGENQFPTLAGSPEDGIMHNKFMIVDVDSVDGSYVLTGSMNWTFGNISEDFNNTVIIQDQSLAINYTIEFEEMWGSYGATPNNSIAKFGEDKVDNTAHLFNINGVEVRSFFSPSDGTQSQIIDAIESADHSIEAAVLLITRRDEIAVPMKDKFFSGVDVKGIFDINDGEAFEFLESNIPNVFYHFPSTMIHHKYVVIDHDESDSDPRVLTGSHNWTYSADNINDENTLVFYDNDISNLYHQEFSKRLEELGFVSNHDLQDENEIMISPNPVNGTLFVGNNILLDVGSSVRYDIDLFDIVGTKVFHTTRAIVPYQIQTNDFDTGIYFIKIRDHETQSLIVSKRVIILGN